MPKQGLTITLTGTGSKLDAESVITAIESIISILRSVDQNSWNVHTQRYSWNVVAVSMQSPMTWGVEAMPRNSATVTEYDVASAMQDGLAALDNDSVSRMPNYFDAKSLENAKRLVGIYRYGVTSISIKSSARPSQIYPSIKIAKSVDTLVNRKPKEYESYGSIDGKLRQITVDDREDHKAATELQIIDRRTDQIVKCRVTIEQAEKLGQYIHKRVVIYGVIRYQDEDTPLSVTVENYDPIDEGSAPSLEDIHKAGIHFLHGRDSADVIDEARENGE